MDLGAAIQEIYPGLVALRDYTVSQGESGPYISSWNNPNPRPTDAQLAEAWFKVAVKKKAADWDARQVKEGGKPYEDALKAATGQEAPPHAVMWNLVMDIVETIRSIEQTTNLKNASDQRKKRDRGFKNLAGKTPGTNPLAAADAVLALRWEDQ